VPKLNPPKTKVLVLLNRLVVGGAAFDTLPLMASLAEEYDFYLLYGKAAKNEFLIQNLAKYQTRFKQTILKGLSRQITVVGDAIAFFHFLWLAYQFKPAIIHSHGAKPGILSRVAKIFFPATKIVHTYHGHFFHSYFNRPLQKWVIGTEKILYKLTDRIIAISNLQQQDIVRYLQLNQQQAAFINVIPVGVDYIHAANSITYRAVFRNQYQLTNQQIAIGWIGRMVAIKDLPALVAIIERTYQLSNPSSIVFFVVGDGPEKTYFQEQLQLKKISVGVEQRHCQEQVVFTNWVNDIETVMHGLDIVVCTSLNEGTPLSLIEAQLAQKPVVAFECGGVADTLQDLQTGYLIRHRNISAFCEAILTLANSENLRIEMGRKAAIFAGNEFNKQKQVQQINALYQYLVKAK
jgi:glycosyltransferase involved in cell wall biosynthesis